MLYNLFENRDFVSVFAVALLAEGVDRNLRKVRIGLVSYVALLAEGVDRNSKKNCTSLVRAPSPSSRRAWIEMIRDAMAFSCRYVALLAEGVDRNKDVFNNLNNLNGSPSSRRAWIEI